MDEDTLLRLNLFFGWTQCHSHTECKLPSSQICHYVNLGYRGRYSLWEKRTHNQNKKSMDSPLPWYAPPSGLWFRGRCAVFFLQLTNIYGRPMMIHLQRDWCWYVEIDPVGRFSLWYFCLWKKCRTSWDLLIWNLIASMGGSRYQLVCQIFSINGIIGGGVIAPWTRTQVLSQPAPSNLWAFLQKENPEKVKFLER